MTEYGADVGLDRDASIHACKSSMNFFGATCLPEVYKFAFPPIFLAIWQLLTAAVSKPSGQEKLAIGLPRGFAKTLVLKLFVIYCILFTDRRFILVVCNTATLAENFIADVVDTLSSNNIITLFGSWRLGMEKDTQELKKFTFKGRNIILAGLGSGSSLRGLNLKYVRPDVILMDDMQSKEESDSQTDSKKQLIWMLGTLLKANDKSRCVFVFLGNMYPSEGCILKKLKNSPDWISFITGAILEDGESLWPELRSVDSLLEELAADESMGHPEIFYSEVMNDDEAGSRSTIDLSLVNVWPDELEDAHQEGGFVLIDPALAKKTSDDCAIGAFKLFDGEPVLWEVKAGKFNEQQKIDNCIEMAARLKFMAVVVEVVAYQESLCFWMDQRKQQIGWDSLKVLTIGVGGMAKNSRILAGLRQLTAKPTQPEAIKERIWVHKTVRSTVTHQIVYWDPLRSKNKDDILDLLGHARRIMIEHGNQLLNPFDMMESSAKAAFSDDLALEF